MKNQKGFTLIELLVVLSIVGTLSTLTMASMGYALQKSRDVKRIANIDHIQKALELYFAEMNSYPVVATPIELGSDNAKSLSGGSGFAATPTGVVFMGQVPKNVGPSGTAYMYTSDGSAFSITFGLEAQTGSLALGPHTVTPEGMK